MRGAPRLVFMATFASLSLMLLLASPFSGHAGRKSRSLISSVVEKVQKGEIGPLRMVGSSATEEELAMREWEYQRAVQYEGTGARIQTFIDKARSGRPFTVSIIGGSVSKGRGSVPVRDTRRRQVESGVDEGEERIESNPLDAERQGEEDESAPVSSPPGGRPKATEKIGADTLYSPENLHVSIFDWLNETFPHPENRLVNGAQGGVGSGYFSWCFKEHIDEQSDLVLVESGINDSIEVDVLGSYEHLIRGVLESPNAPAVINIETFTTLFPTLLSSSALHLDVAAFYDIPSSSIRDILSPRLLGDPETQMPRWFRTGPSVVMGDSKVREWGGVPVDSMHISAKGHASAAGLVIRYFSEQIDKSRPSSFYTFGRSSPGTLRKSSSRILDLPSGASTMPFDPETGSIRHDPTCRSMNSPLYHQNDQGEDERGIAISDSSHGWSTWTWKEKIYLVAKEPGSVLSVPFTVATPAPHVPPPPPPPMSEEEASDDVASEHTDKIGFEPLPLALRPNGALDVNHMGVVIDHVGRRKRSEVVTSPMAKRQYPDAEEIIDGARVVIGFQKSATLGLGSVYCWVDDDRASGTRVEGWWEIEERNMGMVEEVAWGIKPGAHTLHCELSEHTLDPTGGTEFRIFAIMHD